MLHRDQRPGEVALGRAGPERGVDRADTGPQAVLAADVDRRTGERGHREPAGEALGPRQALAEVVLDAELGPGPADAGPGHVDQAGRAPEQAQLVGTPGRVVAHHVPVPHRQVGRPVAGRGLPDVRVQRLARVPRDVRAATQHQPVTGGAGQRPDLPGCVAGGERLLSGDDTTLLGGLGEEDRTHAITMAETAVPRADSSTGPTSAVLWPRVRVSAPAGPATTPRETGGGRPRQPGSRPAARRRGGPPRRRSPRRRGRGWRPARWCPPRRPASAAAP